MRHEDLHIQLNGEDRETSAGISVSELVAELALPKERIAVELNGEVVRRILWDQTTVAAGDRIEIVHFVGGG